MHMSIQVSEVRYLISDIRKVIYTLKKLNIPKTSILHLRDEIWDSDELVKVKVTYSFDLINDNLFYEAKLHPSKPVNYRKSNPPKIIYQGHNFFQLQQEIQKYYLYRLENTIEKIQLNYKSSDTTITLDIYAYGIWVTIKSTENKIWEWSQKLGLNHQKHSPYFDSDDFVVQSSKEHSLTDCENNRFGFSLTKTKGLNQMSTPTFTTKARKLNKYIC